MEKASTNFPNTARADSLFGYFVTSESKQDVVSVPFDKNMVYFITWTPTRKLRALYGFDPRVPKPFTAARLDVPGLQEKNFHQMRSELFKGYQFDAILLPSPGVNMASVGEKQVMVDLFEMLRLNPSYIIDVMDGLEVPCCKIEYGHAARFESEHGTTISLSANPGDPIKIGSKGEIPLQKSW